MKKGTSMHNKEFFILAENFLILALKLGENIVEHIFVFFGEKGHFRPFSKKKDLHHSTGLGFSGFLLNPRKSISNCFWEVSTN
jgi:hypothetical protein